MTEDKYFKEAYKSLNKAQKEAVDAVEGPVMVVAGPGTGKTQILAMRIANILRQTDTAPEQILALTFTENATANMRERLVDLIGSRAYQVVINTFHGFCNNIIKTYPEEFPRIIGSTSITEIDQIALLENIVANLPLKILKPYGDPDYYIRSMVTAIGELKREGITVEEYKNICAEEDVNYWHISDLRHDKGLYKGKIKKDYERLRREIDKNIELVSVYAEYEQKLNEKKLYDFNDMIMEVLRELKTNSNLLLLLQEEHQYILVDEHQDTNNAQNKILELITNFHTNPNLFVVGDEKQAIFRFQGASLENFFYFSRLYPEAKVVVLTDNYRSGQTILNQAEALLPSKTKLQAKATRDTLPIRIGEFGSTQAEYSFLAQDVNEKIASGVSPEEIAVLYRDNKDAVYLALVLRKWGVPFGVESDDDLWLDLDIQKFITILEAVAYFGDDSKLAHLLHIDFFGLPPVDIYKYLRLASDEKMPLIKVLQQNEPDLFSLISGWNIASQNIGLLDLAEKILKESKMVEFFITDQRARERLQSVSSFFDLLASVVESKPESKLNDFLEFLNLARKHKIVLKKKHTGGQKGKVRLLTAHKAKGLEFQHVYIVGAYDGHFGGRKHRDKLTLLNRVYNFSKEGQIDHLAQDDDERRLFYVALTRAKISLTITYSKLSDSGKEQIPSRFVTDLLPDLVQYFDTEQWNNLNQDDQIRLISPAVESVHSLNDRQFVAELFAKQGLSVTALNNYLVCPWQYFYRNLIRLPAIPEKHQLYGSAIHGALQDVFNRAKDQGISLDGLLSAFERRLQEAPLSANDLADTLLKGKESLTGWYKEYSSTFNFNVLTEFKIKGVLLESGVKLVGNLDKIEFLGTGNNVNVVDYKTGKPKSRNQMLGETKDANGDYFRQLVFYRLMLDLFDNNKYQMVSGEIDFIEPNDAGKYKKEKFEISDEEVKKLIEQVNVVADEITNLSFWDRTCGDKDCEYCRLRSLMK